MFFFEKLFNDSMSKLWLRRTYQVNNHYNIQSMEETQVSDKQLPDIAEEILEDLWTQQEKNGISQLSLNLIGITRDNDALHTLIKTKLVTLHQHHVSLTETGEVEAKKVVRRHRLAERLLVDVLDIEDTLVEETACKFEHVIREGIEENVCVLLGHPRVCPHGNTIPPGRCCILGEKNTTRIVMSLAQFDVAHEGRIAYLHTQNKKRLQKLMAMGVLPGKLIQVIQRYPSFVFQIDQTQIAVDEEIANEIFIIQTNAHAR
jgi:DtxR family Mn-dependent transcriptional regulator